MSHAGRLATSAVLGKRRLISGESRSEDWICPLRPSAERARAPGIARRVSRRAGLHDRSMFGVMAGNLVLEPELFLFEAMEQVFVGGRSMFFFFDQRVKRRML